MAKLALCYVVGGEQKQYDNLERSLRSLERLTAHDIHIIILEFGYKCRNLISEYRNFKKENIKISILEIGDVLFFQNKFVDHIIWKSKYHAAYLASVCENSFNDYIFYVDVDTVFVNDTIDHLIQSSNNKFIVTQHFWTPNYLDFVEKTQPKSLPDFHDAASKIGINPSDNFPIATGGVFGFANTIENKKIISKIIDLHQLIYPFVTSDFIDRFTDEVILSWTLDQNKDNVYWANGALNHCVMAQMPLVICKQDNKLYGSNPWENHFDLITCFHCDTTRRDPSAIWQEPLKSRIREAFYL